MLTHLSAVLGLALLATSSPTLEFRTRAIHAEVHPATHTLNLSSGLITPSSLTVQVGDRVNFVAGGPDAPESVTFSDFSLFGIGTSKVPSSHTVQPCTIGTYQVYVDADGTYMVSRSSSSAVTHAAVGATGPGGSGTIIVISGP